MWLLRFRSADLSDLLVFFRAARQGANMTSIETGHAGRINDVCVIRDSGLIIAAVDAPRMEAFFIPSLGPAPMWCSFLENITVSHRLLVLGTSELAGQRGTTPVLCRHDAHGLDCSSSRCMMHEREAQLVP